MGDFIHRRLQLLNDQLNKLKGLIGVPVKQTSGLSLLISSLEKHVDDAVKDIEAGLHLVQKKQQVVPSKPPLADDKGLLPFQQNQGVLPEDGKSIPRPPWMTVPKAAYYMVYAGAAYGFLYMLVDYFPAKPSKVLGDYWKSIKFAYWRLCSIFWTQWDCIDYDGILELDALSILLQSNISPTDFVYVCYKDLVSETPFYVCIDRAARSIIVAVRGTMSLQDAVTDSLCAPAPITEYLTEFPDAMAHGAMLKAARYIQNALKTKRVLQKAFERAPDYQLVVTGHSLGAGTAALLALLLKKEYPGLVCFAFEPPGWLVTLDVSQSMRSYCLSTAVGNDLVPRIGIYTLKKLNRSIVNAVKDVTNPASTAADEADDPKVAVKLYLPGQVLYLQQVEAGGIIQAPKYEPRWCKPEQFDEILVNDKMIVDHMADLVLEALNNTRDSTSGTF